MWRVVVDRITLVPALEIFLLPESAPDQVVNRDRHQRVQRHRIQAAQETFDGAFGEVCPHRDSITNGRCLPRPSTHAYASSASGHRPIECLDAHACFRTVLPAPATFAPA